jgi:hypothetical protein
LSWGNLDRRRDWKRFCWLRYWEVLLGTLVLAVAVAVEKLTMMDLELDRR